MHRLGRSDRSMRVPDASSGPARQATGRDGRPGKAEKDAGAGALRALELPLDPPLAMPPLPLAARPTGTTAAPPRTAAAAPSLADPGAAGALRPAPPAAAARVSYASTKSSTYASLTWCEAAAWRKLGAVADGRAASKASTRDEPMELRPPLPIAELATALPEPRGRPYLPS